MSTRAVQVIRLALLRGMLMEGKLRDGTASQAEDVFASFFPSKKRGKGQSRRSLALAVGSKVVQLISVGECCK